MSPGLPGLGLGGLFFLLSALAGPFLELGRTVRGRSSGAAWLQAGRQFTLALLMIAAVDAVFRLILVFVPAAEGRGGDGSPEAGVAMTLALPLAPIAITAAVLATVLAGVKVLQMRARARSRRPAAACRAAAQAD
jgi:hypothetical protein